MPGAKGKQLISSLAMWHSLVMPTSGTGEAIVLFPSQDGEINLTSNIYPPYLALSNKELGYGVIS